MGLSKKALFSAFFCALCIFTACFFTAGTSTAGSSATSISTSDVAASSGYSETTIQPDECHSVDYDETVTVRYVHDGDTLHLSDKRKIRLIGINTPELARKDKPAEAFALAAKQALQSLVSKSNNRIKLIYDRDRKDHYGRTLAHLFDQSGRNIQAALLSQGLATALVVPPNTRFINCYSKAETTSRQSNIGIWAHHNYKPIQAARIKPKSNGFHIIEDTVKNISITKTNIWINLKNNIGIQIRPKDQGYFDKSYLLCLKDKTIQVRGWLRSRKRGFYMSLRHPAAITLLDANQC